MPSKSLVSLRSLSLDLRRGALSPTCNICHRYAQTQARTSSSPLIPKPTPFVPDVPTFLTLIGRGLSAHAAKIPTWNALFTLSGAQLRAAGIEPARARRYLLWWRDRFRHGISGVGGELQHVREGAAELKIVQVPTQKRSTGDAAAPKMALATLGRDAGMKKIVVNTPPSRIASSEAETSGEDRSPVGVAAPSPNLDTLGTAKKVTGVKILNGMAIGGRGVELVKGRQGVAVLKVREGLWENRRGHKVDGGERRKAEVRAKRRVQERKNAR